VNDVPMRVHEPAGGAEAPGLVLLGHGGGHGKDSPRFAELSRRFADGTGRTVVCIDAVDHGERRPSGVVAPELPAGWHSRVLPQMVDDWRSAAASLAHLGPPVAYVGFSMGAIFGVPTVAALPTIEAAVLVVGGIPAGEWFDDPALEPRLLEDAARLGDRDLLLWNMTGDELIPRAGALAVFDAVPGRRKRITFWAGGHDDWPDAAVDESITFLRQQLAAAAG
jgi:pimeloyl-ACP methyl ester carboxylesterase